MVGGEPEEQNQEVVGQENDGLVSEGKRVKKSIQRQSLTTSHKRIIDAQSVSEQQQRLHPWFLLLTVTLHAMKYLSGQFRPAVLGVKDPYQPLPQPQSTCWEGRVRC